MYFKFLNVNILNNKKILNTEINYKKNIFSFNFTGFFFCYRNYSLMTLQLILAAYVIKLRACIIVLLKKFGKQPKMFSVIFVKFILLIVSEILRINFKSSFMYEYNNFLWFKDNLLFYLYIIWV